MAEQLVFDFEEVWKPIPGHDGYEASNLGRVRSIDRIVVCAGDSRRGSYNRPFKGQLLAASPDSAGYPMIGRWGRVHILVALAFLGPCPDGLEVRHLDGKKRNNRLSNLIYGTTSENMMDRVEHGTSNRGERHGMAKLTRDMVIAIRRDRDSTQTALAQRFGVTSGCIRRILSGKTWGWLKCPS